MDILPPEILQLIVNYNPVDCLKVSKLFRTLIRDNYSVNDYVEKGLQVYLSENAYFELTDHDVYCSLAGYSGNLILAIGKYGNSNCLDYVFKYNMQEDFQVVLFNEFCKRGKVSLVSGLLNKIDNPNLHSSYFFYTCWKRFICSYPSSGDNFLSLLEGIVIGIEHKHLVEYLISYTKKREECTNIAIFNMIYEILQTPFIDSLDIILREFIQRLKRDQIMSCLYKCICDRNRTNFRCIMKYCSNVDIGKGNYPYEHIVNIWKEW